MTLFCTIMCAFCMIETKGHSLEYIEQKYTERQSNARSILRRRKVGMQSFTLRNAQ